MSRLACEIGISRPLLHAHLQTGPMSLLRSRNTSIEQVLRTVE
jgi:hypothetical protein